MSNEPIRIVIIDDTRIRMDCLVFFLGKQKDMIVAGTAATSLQAVEQIRDSKPNTVLIEYSISEESVLEISSTLHRLFPTVRIIILGLTDNISTIISCIEAGIAGYTLKESSFDFLVQMIHSVQRHEALCSPQVIASLFSRLAALSAKTSALHTKEYAALTKRELEVASLVAKGHSNKEIAQRLYIETQTVKNHIHNILEKLHMRNRYEIVKYVQQKAAESSLLTE